MAENTKKTSTKPAGGKASAAKGGEDKASGMKTLGNLSPAPGSHRSTKRLGRGIGSGLGKTAGKGHKGQRARKSGNVRAGFEGGQMKLYMRLPKRGFTNVFRTEYNVVNLDALAHFADGAKIDAKTLDEAGLLRHSHLPVKLLGRGELAKKLDISVHAASAAAQAAVAKAGGTLKLVTQAK
jgi:large subunit ribosomal protein L15